MSSAKNNTLQFEDISYLGAGTFATVRKVKYKDKIVAVKIFKPNAKDFMKEVNELKKVDHPNIIKLISYGKWRDKLDVFNCIIIEYADVGSLHHVLYETDLSYSLEHGISWLMQCADAINYLHTMTPKPTIHRDLKPLNLLLLKGGQILKVCDFGTATNIRTFMTVDRGSPCWIAPEQLMNEQYNEKCDVYSYAIIAWEIICRLSPYFDKPNLTSAQIMLGVTRATNPLRPKPVASCPQVIELLIERGMDGDPNRRPSMQLIFNIMKQLDAIVNTTPIKPVKETADSYESSKNTNETNTIVNKIDTGIYSPASSSNQTQVNEAAASQYKNVMYRNISDNHVSHDKNSQNQYGHRRSRSDGNGKLEIQKIKTEISNRIETMLYEPLEPLYDNNDSIKIFKDHLSLIKLDESLQKKINNLRTQEDQYKQTIKNINTYNELLKQKNMLLSENAKLRKMLK